MADNQRNTEKKLRFEPTTIGLHEFLQEFKPIWKLFESLVKGGVVSETTEKISGLWEKKGSLTQYASRLLERGGTEVDYRKTIGFGVKIMNETQDFIESLIDPMVANSHFDQMCKEIEKISKAVWESKKEDIGNARAIFTKVEQGDDLAEAVGRYSEVIRLLRAVIHTAQDTAKAEQDRDSTSRRKEKMEKAHSGAKQLLASLA